MSALFKIRGYLSILLGALADESLLEVHAGRDPKNVLKSSNELSKLNSVGLPVENVLKIAKWLFIDEAIKYWGHGGRNGWKASLDDSATSNSRSSNPR
jgi:hypothetical protein